MLKCDRYKHIENLEERLKRMEAMLQGQVSIQSAEDDTESEHQTGSRNVGGKRKASHPLKHPPGSGQAQKRKRKQNRRASIRSNSSSSQLGEEQIPESSQDSMIPIFTRSFISVDNFQDLHIWEMILRFLSHTGGSQYRPTSLPATSLNNSLQKMKLGF